jgi:hypothetical protein
VHPIQAFLPIFGQTVYVYTLGDDIADDHSRVQGGLGVLENHLHLAVERLALIALRLVDVLAPEEHLAARRLVEPDQHPSHGRLAATRLADKAERLALFDLECDPVDRLQVHLADPEVLLEVFDLEQRPAVLLAVRAPVPDLFRHFAPVIRAGGSTLGAIWWCSQHAALCSSENVV